jgi:hypothetical protein
VTRRERDGRQPTGPCGARMSIDAISSAPAQLDDNRAGARGGLVRWWQSRHGAELIREVSLVVGLLLMYRLGRYLSRDHVAAAFDNATAVLHFEAHFGLAVEADIQGLVLPHHWLTTLLNQYYVRVHFPATVAFLVVMYLRAPIRYRHMRRLFVVVTGLGLALHVAYPLAPPRMMPGFVDTIARYGPAIYERSDVSSVANQYAAMPSMHFAWAVLVAYGLLRAIRGPWRWLAITHPVITLVAITATANHYWLDAAVAAALIAVALLVVNRTSPWPAPAHSDAKSSGLTWSMNSLNCSTISSGTPSPGARPAAASTPSSAYTGAP